MTTARDIITRSLRRIGVVAVDEDPDGTYAAAALDRLNAMIFGWKLWSVDVSHVALELGDSIALGPEYDLSLEYLLAKEIVSDYPYSLSSVDLSRADDAWRAIYSAYVVIPEATLPRSITCLPSQNEDTWAFTVSV